MICLMRKGRKGLNIYSLHKRRIIQILKIVFKIRFKLYEYKNRTNKWENELNIYQTSRQGIYCQTYKQKSICNKDFFYKCLKSFQFFASIYKI